MNKIILEMENVYKTYKAGDKEVYALKDFNYSFKEGSFNVILGPSGSGKSTLIRMAGLLEEPTKGKIYINGNDSASIKKMNSFIQNNIGFIFQNNNLIPSLNALENVMLSMNSKDSERAKLLLDMVEFNEFNKYPNELSFEEKQKIAIARALINDHSLILADEPTGELHTDDAIKMINLLLDLNKNEKLTIIMATNNNMLSKFGENVINIVDGMNIQ
jgi:putative ABC transport system ATP-binding protein